MAERTTRVRVPAKARRGEIIQIKCMIMHPMENGFRFDTQGTFVPIHLINTFECRYNGEEVFRTRLGTGMAANPLLTFNTIATESGTIDFRWYDDDGSQHTAQARIEVE